MTIPLTKFPSLANRAVLVRGPSQGYWHQDAERYHQDRDPPEKFCTQTLKVHETLQTALETNKDRLYSHWLLVFPEGTMLENHVMSDNAEHVKGHSFDLIGSSMHMQMKVPRTRLQKWRYLGWTSIGGLL
jgi:hypothetical protein